MEPQETNPYSLLTLLEGGTIHPPLGTKVIKKELLGKLLEGKALIEKVKEERQLYKIESLKELEEAKQKAFQEGFQEGFDSWLEKVSLLEQEISRVKEGLEKQVVSIALKAAKKIVAQELTLHPEAILDIVKSHLKAVSQSKRIAIAVSREDFELLDKNRNQLKEKLESLEVLTIRSRDDLPRGSCVIETESGIVNATLENQWARIEKAFGIEEKRV